MRHSDANTGVRVSCSYIRDITNYLSGDHHLEGVGNGENES